MTVTTSEGPRKYTMFVFADPCKHPEKLNRQYVDPFSGQSLSLQESAPEVTCDGNKLHGAHYSDGGYPVLGMFFMDASDISRVVPPATKVLGDDPTFGYGKMCAARKAQGYNSGMGLIFHLVANISEAPGGVAPL